MTISLNESTKRSIEKVTGISYVDIVSMDVEDLDKRIEKKIGKKLRFKPLNDERLIGRGSVYLTLNRFFELNHKSLNRFIDRLKK